MTSVAAEKTWTVVELLDWTTDYFVRAGITEARPDAEVLLASAIGCPRLELILKNNAPVAPSVLEAYRGYVRQRRGRKPVAYIVAQREFMGMSFLVNEHTLIPRPETELLVEAALAIIKRDKSMSICDVGTGSGAIAVSVAGLSDVQYMYALDVSADALAVCCKNAERHGQAHKVILRQGDLFGALSGQDKELCFDMVISNPPYVTTQELAALEPELAFEPRIAFDGGSDGLQFYRRLAQEGCPHLRTGGYLVCELHAYKALEIAQIFKDNGFTIEEIQKDYAGLDRILIAQKHTKAERVQRTK